MGLILKLVLALSFQLLIKVGPTFGQKFCMGKRGTWISSYLPLERVLLFNWDWCEIALCHSIQKEHIPGNKTFTHQHRPVHPGPLPSQPYTHSGRIPPCWRSGRSYTCLESHIHQCLRTDTAKSFFQTLLFTKWTVKRLESIKINKFPAKAEVIKVLRYLIH